jgi:cysteinyl-tRNA synthetase
VFDFVSAANRLLDGGESPGPETLRAWARVVEVLDAATVPQVTEVAADAPVDSRLPDEPPTEAGDRLAWAGAWARARAAAKARRDYAEADRIRGLLQEHGFEVRDRKDGTAEVVRKG